jgi:hypothetical protein
MTEIINIGKEILNNGALVALVGLLAVLAIPKLRKKYWGNGNGNEEKIKENREMIAELKKHAEVANHEMAEIKEVLGKISVDIEWIKKSLK